MRLRLYKITLFSVAHTHLHKSCLDYKNDSISKENSWHFHSSRMTSSAYYKDFTLYIKTCSASEKINSSWEGRAGYAKGCYWSLYSWNHLCGLATAAPSSLINVCQKPGGDLMGVKSSVKSLWNDASHHQQEWRGGGDTGKRRQRKTKRIESNFWLPQRGQIAR